MQRALWAFGLVAWLDSAHLWQRVKTCNTEHKDGSLENKRPTVNWPIQYSLPGYEFESQAYIATSSVASGCANGSAYSSMFSKFFQRPTNPPDTKMVSFPSSNTVSVPSGRPRQNDASRSINMQPRQNDARRSINMQPRQNDASRSINMQPRQNDARNDRTMMQPATTARRRRLEVNVRSE
jgi:hypothetical protein